MEDAGRRMAGTRDVEDAVPYEGPVSVHVKTIVSAI
jgi:hypothetical protein